MITDCFYWQVGFVQDPEHKKLGGHTGPWQEERPHSEMLEDFASFTPQLLEMLKVGADSSR